MTNRTKLTLSIICWAIVLIVVVLWIVTYCGLFNMNEHQTLIYIGVYKIDTQLFETTPMSELAQQFNVWFRQAADHSFTDAYGWYAYGKLNDQITRSIALFHLGYALFTAAFLTGGITFAVLLVKSKRKANVQRGELTDGKL